MYVSPPLKIAHVDCVFDGNHIAFCIFVANQATPGQGT